MERQVKRHETDPQPEQENDLERLMELMARLRGPQGCPWDREQTRESLKPSLVEEAFEVLEALDEGRPEALCEELGDLLFQVVFHSQISSERGEFDLKDVCRRLCRKLVGRHPHVFAAASYRSSKELLRDWEEIKARERKSVGSKVQRASLLDGVPARLPAVYAALQLSSKAARVGFDWPTISAIGEKLVEEFRELEAALEEGSREEVQEEVGDLIFTVLNAARQAGVDPETALARANRKFARRFRKMERHFTKAGRALKDVPRSRMEAYWEEERDE